MSERDYFEGFDAGKKERDDLRDEIKKLRKINKKQQEYINKIKTALSYLPFSIEEIMDRV